MWRKERRVSNGERDDDDVCRILGQGKYREVKRADLDGEEINKKYNNKDIGDESGRTVEMGKGEESDPILSR